MSSVLGRPIAQRLFLFGLSYRVILHCSFVYLAYVILNDEMRHVKGNSYGLFEGITPTCIWIMFLVSVAISSQEFRPRTIRKQCTSVTAKTGG